MIPLRKNRKVLLSNSNVNVFKNYFKVVDNYKEHFDYLVMRSFSRTFKALLAICKGIPIVSEEWITDSERLTTVMKVERYYFEKLDHVYKAIEIAQDGKKVFDKLEFFLVSEEFHLPKEQIEALIQAGGGKIIKKMSGKERLIGILRKKDIKNTK